MEIYEGINKDAYLYLKKELETKKLNKKYLNRCYKELEMLYKNNIIFIIKHLYLYLKENKNIKILLKGNFNNLLVLYLLKVTIVDPVKYNLPYELYTTKNINLCFLNGDYKNFLKYLNDKLKDYKIIKINHKLTNQKEIDENLINNFIIIPTNDSLLKKIKNNKINATKKIKNYVKIILNNKKEYEESSLEKELINKIKPKTINNYIQIEKIYLNIC